MYQILAATKNKGKLEEYKELLKDKQVQILSMNDFDDFPETEEDGKTFEENAEKKALEASNYAGIPAFADDSGLAVEALGGAPGIHSSRYAGPGATDADRVNKLLNELKDEKNRNAKFVCALTIANEGEIIKTFRGEVHGTITESPRGKNGFGYDPVFIPEGFDKTFGELDSSIKDKISHRAVAVKEAVEYIEDELSTIEDFEEFE